MLRSAGCRGIVSSFLEWELKEGVEGSEPTSTYSLTILEFGWCLIKSIGSCSLQCYHVLIVAAVWAVKSPLLPRYIVAHRIQRFEPSGRKVGGHTRKRVYETRLPLIAGALHLNSRIASQCHHGRVGQSSNHPASCPLHINLWCYYDKMLGISVGKLFARFEVLILYPL